MLRAIIREEPWLTIARFQSDLNFDIRDRVELLPYNDLFQLCIRVKEQLNRNNYFWKSSFSSTYPNKDYRKNSYEKGKPHDRERDKTQIKDKEKNYYVSSSKIVKTKQVQFFKCMEKGHYSFEMSTKENLTFKRPKHLRDWDFIFCLWGWRSHIFLERNPTLYKRFNISSTTSSKSSPKNKYVTMRNLFHTNEDLEGSAPMNQDQPPRRKTRSMPQDIGSDQDSPTTTSTPSLPRGSQGAEHKLWVLRVSGFHYC